MVSPVFNEAKVVALQPKTVEAFEGMMRDLVIKSRNYKSPFAAKQKEIIIHNPAKNPFAPLYRPDREVLYTMDKYHQFEPPKGLSSVKEEQPKKIFAAAGGTIPPDPSKNIYNNNFKESLTDFKNNLVTKDISIMNKNNKI